MKKAISVIWAVLMCLCITGCSGSKIPSLYQMITTEFVNGIGSTSLEEIKSYAESNSLKFEKNTDNIYKISNGGKWDASFYFSYDKLLVLSFQEVKSERSIHISQSTISFTNGEDVTKYYDTLADCEKYVFGAVSGTDYTVEKRETSSSPTQSSISSKPSNGNSSSLGISLRYGKLLSKNVNGTTLVIKAKIEPSYSNKATVDQNYYNIEDFVKKQGGTKYKEIQYWAVADMSNGSEQKVISFTVSENVIKKIANDEIVANQMGNYVDDLFIHASLR